MVFAASGGIQASWLSRLPTLDAQFALRPLGIGLGLFCVSTGWVLAMPFASIVCARYGMRRVITVAGLAACVSVGLLGLVMDTWSLGLALFLFGLGGGMCDAAMNIHASTVDKASDRPRMPVYHGLWSLGTALGAGAGAMTAHVDVSMSAHLAGAAGVAAVVFVAAGPGLLSERSARPDRHVWPSPRLLLAIGGFMLCAAIVEGAAADWVPVYLTSERLATTAAGVLAYVLFAVAMAVGRFAALPLQRRWGRAATVRAGAVIAALSVPLVLTPLGPASYLGAVLWGLGIAPAFPAAISAGGEGIRPADTIAALTTLGYAASLGGPLAIGALGEFVGIGVALGILLPGLALTASLLATRLGPGRVGPA